MSRVKEDVALVNRGIARLKAGAVADDQKRSHKINNAGTVAVSQEVWFIPVSADTPRGVKLQLLGAGGVAVYGVYHGDPFWTHWQALPKIPK